MPPPPTDKLKWMDLPPIEFRQGGGRARPQFLTTLRKRPKQWALIRRRPFRISSTFFKRHHGYEFVIRRMPEGDFGLFARFVGGKDV